ncbi:MAG: DUF523 domain-containing protein [Alphaproteobacteria bacterium]|nr:DUF523 domain-containing protein [Alphaproteobacteria bacterium]
MKLVSACLCGLNCRFNGTGKLDPEILEMVASGKAIPVCPEQLGGLPTPRECCELKNGRAKSAAGNDYTEGFERGAEEVLRLAREIGADEFIGKSKSPSCGTGQVYDGTFSGTLTDGDGITVKLLRENGIRTSNK